MKTLTKSFKVVVGMLLASRNQAVKTKLGRHSRLLTDVICQILAHKGSTVLHLAKVVANYAIILFK
jgi:flagellar basal body-associated protein FliL